MSDARVTAVAISPQPLRVLGEAKVAVLLGLPDGQRLEASGVCTHDGVTYVIFDNAPGIARLVDVSGHDPANRVLEAGGGRPDGFEDITRDPLTGHFYVLIEAVPHGSAWRAEVQEHDAEGRYLDTAALDFTLERANKGIEGLACVVRNGETYLLGLCEGNHCKGGDAGRQPGGGRIHVFRRDGRDAAWRGPGETAGATARPRAGGGACGRTSG